MTQPATNPSPGLSLAALLGGMRPLEPRRAQALATTERLIRHDWKALAFAGGPTYAPQLLEVIEAALERLREQAHTPALDGRLVVGVGGAFSAGKSSFLNALLGGDRVLPTGLRPTTAVPTYLLPDREGAIRLVNVFDEAVSLTLEQFKHLTHQSATQEGFRLSRLLKAAYVQVPHPRYHSLAFLDTPGYDKADGLGLSSEADEVIARASLQAVDAVIWLADAERGLTSGDLTFLKSLALEVPLLVVVTRADKVAQAELPAILDRATGDLTTAGLEAVAVVPFTLRHQPGKELPMHRWIAYLAENGRVRPMDAAIISGLYPFKTFQSERRKHEELRLRQLKEAALGCSDVAARALLNDLAKEASMDLSVRHASIKAYDALDANLREALRVLREAMAEPPTHTAAAPTVQPSRRRRRKKPKPQQPVHQPDGLTLTIPAAQPRRKSPRNRQRNRK